MTLKKLWRSSIPQRSGVTLPLSNMVMTLSRYVPQRPPNPIGSEQHPADALKIGTNRREELPLEGYIDEFKIYERGLSSQEVCNLYNNNSPITTAASCTQESRVAAQDEPAYVVIVDDNTKAARLSRIGWIQTLFNCWTSK